MVKRNLFHVLGILLAVLASVSCKRTSRVEMAAETQTFLMGNGTEPEGLDPHIVTGVPESRIFQALLEGLVGIDHATLEPVNDAAAQSWEIAEDGLTYTFHLRPDATWSNPERDPVTAHDFVYSYHRILHPDTASKYAYMLFPLTNAEDFNKGEITDFSQVGVTALDTFTLELKLESPTPYLLGILNHYSWWPVHPPTIEKHGTMTQRSSPWTRAEHFVGNGPFRLTEWTVNNRIVTEKREDYWDADRVKLNRVIFYPIENLETEQRAYQQGYIHLTYDIPAHRIRWNLENYPEETEIDPYLGVYYYRINVKPSAPGADQAGRDALMDKRVRKALAISVDRQAICDFLAAGQLPAYSFVPPGTSGYEPDAILEESLEEAQELLAEAGYPDGSGIPEFHLYYNTHENHKQVAEIIQQQWNKNLGIRVALFNQEWKSYLNTVANFNYDLARAAWIGDYNDPNTFLDMWVTDGGNNQTGFSNTRYDELIRLASRTAEPEKRLRLFQEAENILLEELPVIPVYFYVSKHMLHPSVKGRPPNILDRHPFKDVYLDPSVFNS